MQYRKNVLVTGGTGFLGANLIRKLIKRKYKVNVLSRKNSNYWRLKPIIKDLKIFELNLLNETKLKKTVEKINPMAIFHLAAYGGNSRENDIEEILKINIQYTFNLLKASNNIDYSVFVNTGSSSEYGFKKKPMKETDFLEPNSFYAATKASTTFLCQVFAQKFNKPIVTVRPFSVYGPFEAKQRFISTITRAIIKGERIKLTSGNIRRDFIYIDDIIDIYLGLIKKGKLLKGKVINAGAGKEYTNDEVVQTLFRVTRKIVPIKKGSFKERSRDTDHWKADVSFAKKSLNWIPKYSLGKGLLKNYKWFLENINLYD